MFLSQTDAWAVANGGKEISWRTRNRLMLEPMDQGDFYALTNRMKWFYEDADFPKGPDVLYWANEGEGRMSVAKKEKEKGIKFSRASETFPKATLWGEGGVSVEDVSQGSLGNCWLCASFASLAENPDAVQNLFLNTKTKQSPSGLYGVNLFVLGHQMTIVVDDYLPVTYSHADLDGSSVFSTIFSKVTEGGSLWVPILEKVFAKRYGNY